MNPVSIYTKFGTVSKDLIPVVYRMFTEKTSFLDELMIYLSNFEIFFCIPS